MIIEEEPEAENQVSRCWMLDQSDFNSPQQTPRKFLFTPKNADHKPSPGFLPRRFD